MIDSMPKFAGLAEYLGRHRVLLFAFTSAAIVACLLVSLRARMDEDIRSMLPDNGRVAREFELLQRAPFARKLVVTLTARDGVTREGLIEATDRLAASMTPPFFSKVVTGPETGASYESFRLFLGNLPSLIDHEDLRSIAGGLTVPSVRNRLQETFAQFLSPSGLAIKPLIERDPLNFRSLAFRKLEFLKLVPEVGISADHFVSNDGKSTLIIADTPTPMADSAASRQLLNHFNELVKSVVPSTIETTFISGHRYTVANADTIKRDLVVILTCSSVSMLLLFVLFLKTWRALFIFLVPASVLCFATAATVLIYDSVSAVTIGFASVLLGITDDYPIHVYFSGRKAKKAGEIVAEVWKPILFSGITILGAFGALLLSDLPGQRQIGVFSMIGILGAMVLSLVVLPHIVGSMKRRAAPDGMRHVTAGSRFPGWVTLLWIVVLGLSVWQLTNLHFNGDLRTVGFVPDSLKKAERHTQEVWGDFRSMGMLFSSGPDVQRAMETNDLLFGEIRAEWPRLKLISISPVLPSLLTQESNRKRWVGFWGGKKGKEAHETIAREAASVGFSREAFDPFYEGLLKGGEPITADLMRKAGLGNLIDSFITEEAGNTTVLTLVPDIPGLANLVARQPLASADVTLVSPSRFRSEIGREILNNFAIYLMAAFIVIVLLLSLLYRNLRGVLLAMIPVATGMIFMLGVMGLLRIEFNIFNIVAAILVVGLAVDFGIFMVHRMTEESDRSTETAVLLGGLTTVSGVGMLVLARHPALYSIGVTVLLGLSGAIPSALFVIPAVDQIFFRRTRPHFPGTRRENSHGRLQ